MKTRIIVTAIVLVCFGVFGLCAHYVGYQQGHKAATAETEQRIQKQRINALLKAHELNAQLQTKLEEIEHEKQQTIIANQSMRTELDRLQQRISKNTSSLSASAASTGESESHEAARSWLLLGNCAKEYAKMTEIADQQRDALAQWQAYGEVAIK